jgi:TolB protein
MTATGENVRLLIEEIRYPAEPSWSPLGDQIAFTASEGGIEYGIFVIDTDGSNVHRVTMETRFALSPTWSPDGTRIAFISSSDNMHRQVFVMDADGSNMRPLTSNTECNAYLPSWHP